MRVILILAGCIALSGCVTPTIVYPKVATGGVAVSPDHSEFMISQFRYNLMVAHGVPSAWFSPAPGDTAFPFRLSREAEGPAYDIMQKDRNP